MPGKAAGPASYLIVGTNTGTETGFQQSQKNDEIRIRKHCDVWQLLIFIGYYNKPIMRLADTNPRLYRIFRELQGKGLIGRERRLVQCPFTLSVRGCPTLNSIRYRRAFYQKNLSCASDDTLRFVLLHEEGHIRKGSSWISALLVLPVLPYLLLLLQPYGDSLFQGILPSLQAGTFPAVKIALVAALALTSLLGYRAYYRRMYDEEFTADQYAAEVMRRHYRIRDPGALLQTLLSGLRAVPDRFRSGPDYRPSITERVQRVRDSTGPTGGDGCSVIYRRDTSLPR